MQPEEVRAQLRRFGLKDEEIEGVEWPGASAERPWNTFDEPFQAGQDAKEEDDE